MEEIQNDRELIFTRLLDAPRALVYKVWTDPEHIVHWWGPNGFTNTNHGMDVSPGGAWRFTMHGPDGRDYKNKIVFLEVAEPERLVYQHSDDGEAEPVHFHVTVTFEPLGNKTLLTMRMVFDTKADLERVAREYGAIEGAHQNIARMEAYVTNPDLKVNHALPFVISREFNAPRELVFKVFSEAQHLAQWWGPKGMKINVMKLDFRPGGMFHYNMVAENGFIMWGLFTYRDIATPEKIVWVNSFSDELGNITAPPFADPWPKEIFNILTLEESGGKTTLTIKGGPIHATDEERQTFINGFSSMQQGFGGTFDQLRDYLATLTILHTPASPFTIERTLKAPADLVWKAISEKEQMKEWYFDLAEFKPEVGFEFRFLGGHEDGIQYQHVCVITEVIPQRKLTYSWRYEGYEGISYVTFELFTEGDATRIKLTHAGLETFPASNHDFAKENFAEGWTHIIGTALKAFIEK